MSVLNLIPELSFAAALLLLLVVAAGALWFTDWNQQ